jgi:hypothetical protein
MASEQLGDTKWRAVVAALSWATILTVLAGGAYGVLFQGGKFGPFRGINPFAEDPADAVGSIAVQVIVVAQLITVARLIRVRAELAALPGKARWLLQGNALTLAAVWVSLVADTLAEMQQPTWGISLYGKLLVVGLAGVAALALIASAALWRAWRLVRREELWQPGRTRPEQLAEAIGDLWAALLAVVGWAARRVTILEPIYHWLNSLSESRWLQRLTSISWLDPRGHPWRFCFTVSLAAGLAIALAQQLEEGPPADWALAVGVAALFVGIELAAALLGFLTLGGLLGLRPPLRGR